MEERSHRTARFVAVIAATTISLACGTNYAYSAWGPQFADRLKLSATQSNLIGAFGNVGMYASGIPFGHMVDTRGPRPGILLGSVLLAGGYFPIKKAYDGGPGSMSVFLLCLFSTFTGCGSCSAFQAAIKTSALNWPLHRGTATAFPLSAFGLSALFFTTLAGFIFPGDTSDFLLILAIGTFCLAIVPLLFIRIPRPEQYQALASNEEGPGLGRRDSTHLHRSSSWQSKYSSTRQHDEPPSEQAPLPASENDRPPNDVEAVETSSLLSTSSGPGDIASEGAATKHHHHHGSHRADISGFSLLRHPEFYLIFILVGALTGIGLMTINNIGNDATALWLAYDGSAPKSFILKRQLFHVSVISLLSFCGRLLSGIGSDILIKKLHTSRFWCLVGSGVLFTAAQIAALSIRNPHLLVIVSGLTGLAYGALFGVSPSLVADAFGVHVLAINWGVMMLGPVIFGNVFNVAYGRIFDANSQYTEDGDLRCGKGLSCYRNAYWITFVVSLVGVAVGLWSVKLDMERKRRELREDEEHEEHLA